MLQLILNAQLKLAKLFTSLFIFLAEKLYASKKPYKIGQGVKEEPQNKILLEQEIHELKLKQKDVSHKNPERAREAQERKVALEREKEARRRAKLQTEKEAKAKKQQAILQKAKDFLSEGNNVQAKKIIMALLKEEPRFIEALLLKAQCEENITDFDAGIETYSVILDYEPQHQLPLERKAMLSSNRAHLRQEAETVGLLIEKIISGLINGLTYVSTSPAVAGLAPGFSKGR